MLDIINHFFRMGISEEDYEKLKINLNSKNQKNLIFLSRILTILMVPGLIFVYVFYGGLKPRFWIYLSLFVFTFLSFLLAHRESKHTNLQIYIFISILIGYSIVLSTRMNPDMMAVKYIAFILALPMLFTDQPIRVSLYICACTAVFILCAIHFDARHILPLDIFHALIFGAVSIVTSTYLSKIKIQRLYFEKKWKTTSETDLMTGLHSRNLYEQRLNSYPKTCKKNLICVFLDVNGLHEIDIHQGYDVGDRVLQMTASIFQQALGQENTFRIGGDEFIALLPDTQKNHIQAITKHIYEQTRQSGISVSIGISNMNKEDMDIHLLTKRAAKEMSEVKRRYYQNAKIDRRSR